MSDARCSSQQHNMSIQHTTSPTNNMCSSSNQNYVIHCNEHVDVHISVWCVLLTAIHCPDVSRVLVLATIYLAGFKLSDWSITEGSNLMNIFLNITPMLGRKTELQTRTKKDQIPAYMLLFSPTIIEEWYERWKMSIWRSSHVISSTSTRI